MLNPGALDEALADGLGRMAPALRLQYVALIAKVYDTLVPPDCFGLYEMDAVIDRVSLNAMSDADIDGYFRMLLVIRNGDRAAYCDSLDDACVSNNHAGIARLIAESVLRSFDLYFDALGLACRPRTFLGPSVNNRIPTLRRAVALSLTFHVDGVTPRPSGQMLD
ncbi:filamentation induced by cAMP protein Fic [Caballeronia glebae]|jgi:hypothetical protein|uniref:Filamentation induced by cAMP protein Fic n=1 Tax=Caballeronia glebae TaxID=1777143 RepID=A0A158CZ45_9BURK|nr:hypothetical protein [Caballeronia glebae]SAK87360.1 filamentation induced by cAMP protein Fic [Caballeronia glebae]